MGYRGSKSVGIDINPTVKEQRVDGSSVFNLDAVRYTLVAGKSGSWYSNYLLTLNN